MKLRFKIHLISALVFTILLCAIVIVSNAQEVATQTTTESTSWISKYWSVIALIVSEGLSFLPAKFAGILKSIGSLLSGISKKK